MEDNLPQGLLWNDALPSITLIRWNWRGLLILAQRTRLSYFMGRLTAGPKSEIGQKSGFTWIYCSIKSWVGWSDFFNSPPNHLHPPEKRTRMPLLKIAGKTAPFVESFTFQDTWIHGGSTNFLNRFWTIFLSHAGFETFYLTSSNDPLPGNCLTWPFRGSPTIEDQVREELFITWWGIFIIFEAFWSPIPKSRRPKSAAPVYRSVPFTHKLPTLPSILPSGDEFTRSSGGGVVSHGFSSPGGRWKGITQ